MIVFLRRLQHNEITPGKDVTTSVIQVRAVVF